MPDGASNYIPIITSEAGLCLTAENWQEAKVSSLSFYLDSLLLKPGYDALNAIPDVSRYMGWTQHTILNATTCLSNKEGVFTLTSPYDGSRLKLHYAQLTEIMQHINPDMVILPPKILKEFPTFWSHWNTLVIPFFAAEDLLTYPVQRSHGVYFKLDELTSEDSFLEQIKKWSHVPRYVIGPCTLSFMLALKKEGVEWIESDQPAIMGLHGEVLSQKEPIRLTESVNAVQFETIDVDCGCPTCAQKLTKAYLHHLYMHTPLLCQRFLIQHNVYYAQNYRGN